MDDGRVVGHHPGAGGWLMGSISVDERFVPPLYRGDWMSSKCMFTHLWFGLGVGLFYCLTTAHNHSEVRYADGLVESIELHGFDFHLFGPGVQDSRESQGKPRLACFFINI